MPNRRGAVSILLGHATAMSYGLFADAFKRQARFRIVGHATTVDGILEAAQLLKVDILMISTELEDGVLNGFVAARRVHECCPDVRSVMLLKKPDLQLVVDSFRAGAKGVFYRSQFQFETLCRCLNQVHDGQIWATSEELSYVIEAFARMAPLRIVNAGGFKLLTKREEDVVRLVAEGLSNRDVAKELNLSEHTVKNYLFHIFDKVGISSRVELVLYALNSTNRVKQAQTTSKGDKMSEVSSPA
jgi:DNA-binding NarL/FixJ family response regulator